jgi:hypothetical protein
MPLASTFSMRSCGLAGCNDQLQTAKRADKFLGLILIQYSALHSGICFSGMRGADFLAFRFAYG